MSERISVEGLRYARAVLETGSFSAAARAYGVTQPALSNGIAKLEERLGQRLFNRSTRGVTPTTFGSQILPLVSQAIQALDAVDAEARRLGGVGDGTIRLGVSPLIDARLVATAYREVCRLPDLQDPRQLVMREANMHDLRDALIADDLDLILIPSVGPLSGFEHRVVGSETMVLVEPDDNSRGEAVQLDEIGDRQLILMPNTCGLTTFTEDLLRSHDLGFRTYPGEASSYRVLEEWPNLGLGSALLPRSKLSAADTHYRLLLDGDDEVEIFYEAVWKPTTALAPLLAVLADRLASQPE